MIRVMTTSLLHACPTIASSVCLSHPSASRPTTIVTLYRTRVGDKSRCTPIPAKPYQSVQRLLSPTLGSLPWSKRHVATRCLLPFSALPMVADCPALALHTRICWRSCFGLKIELMTHFLLLTLCSSIFSDSLGTK